MARVRRPGRGRVASPGGAGGPRAGASAAAARAGTRRSRRRRRAKAGAAACGGARWRRCSDRGGAGGPRNGAARRQGRLGGLGALGGGARASARAARGGTAAAPWRPRRRGSGAAAVARNSAGEEVGEGEESAAELTRGSIWAEMDRRWGFNGEGELRGGRRGWIVAAARFWPGGGSAELKDGRRRWRAMLRSSGCGESKHGDAGWSARTPAWRAAG